MEDKYIPLEEAASLESISYTGLISRINRNPSSYCFNRIPNELGGKERILISINSLSKKAQRAYRKSLEIETKSETKSDEAPWYLDIDLNWYIENNKERYYKAVEQAAMIQNFMKSSTKKKKTIEADLLSVELGCDRRTLYRNIDAILEAQAWALKMEKEEKHSFDYFIPLALCRKPRVSKTFPSLSAEQKAIIENIWFNKTFAMNHGTIEMLYEAFQVQADKRGWESIPSCKTVGRYVKHCMTEKKGYNAHYLAENGMKAFRNRQMVKATRDCSSLAVMEFVQGDEHTFDLWVTVKQSNGKEKAVRPKLVCWIDTRTRCIMGDIICVDANAEILKQSLVKMLYSTPGGVPKHLHIDNGKDYTAKTNTGQDRNERAMKDDLEFDPETIGFYRSIGINEWSRALPYEPWSKGQIERFFGTVCRKFSRWFDSYVGTLTASKTSSKIEKDIAKKLDKGELLTIEEFYGYWTKFKDEYYHVRDHSALKKEKQKWTSPLALFENCEDRYDKKPPTREYVNALLMHSEIKPVKNVGITKFGTLYQNELLNHYINQKVRIKWEPDDVTTIHVYTLDDVKICDAQSAELLKIAPKVPQEALERHMQAQKRQIKDAREALNRFNMPPELRVTDTETPKVIGGLELGIKGTGNKVVEVPLNLVAAKSENKQQKQVDDEVNDYLVNRGNQVLYLLQQEGMKNE